uniref:Putative secreted protein n=1 Tax=Amblyomma parvum TaxID=251391 RepID=A0A023G2K0_AMBPA
MFVVVSKGLICMLLWVFASIGGPEIMRRAHTRKATYGWYKSSFVVSCVPSIPVLPLSSVPAHCCYFMLPLPYFLHHYFFSSASAHHLCLNVAPHVAVIFNMH